MRLFLLVFCFVSLTIGSIQEIKKVVINRKESNGWVVVLNDSVSTKQWRELLSEWKHLPESECSFKHIYEDVFKGFSGHFSTSFLDNLHSKGIIKIIEPNHQVRISSVQYDTPSYGIDRVDQRDLPLNQTFYYDDLAGEGVQVFVLDTGIRHTHEDFEGRATKGPNYVEEDPTDDDYHGHGTHVSGITIGKKFGIAKRARLVHVKVMAGDGGGWISDVTAGVNWIYRQFGNDPNKKYVCNLSMTTVGQGASLDEAISKSVNAGIVYVAAAGNGQFVPNDACGISPGKNPDVIAVASSDETDTRPDWSNYGKCVAITAPGRAIISTTNLDDKGSRTMSGTSQSSPHVVGAAALLMSHGNFTPQQVREKILSVATKGVLKGLLPNTPNLLLFTNP